MSGGRELPEGWRWAPLGELGELVTGSTPSTRIKEHFGGEIPFFKPTDLNAGYFLRTATDTLSKSGAAASRLLPERSVLVTCIGATIGKTALARVAGATNQQINAVVPGNAALAEWLYWWFVSGNGQDAIISNASATTLPILNKGRFAVLELPVPPLPEQRRIVAKLEALQARSRHAREALEAVPPLLEKLRQSILAAAFRGDLTADWREKHPEVEPASELLKRIRVERRKKWEEAELAKLKAKGKPPTDDRWKQKYVEPEPVDDSDLPELPEGWGWARAEEVCQLITKGTTPAAEELTSDGEIPFIKVYNLTFTGKLDFSIEPTFVDRSVHDAELSRSRVFPGQVLMNIVGPPLGKVSIVPDRFPEWNINQAIAVFPQLSGIASEYLACHLLSSRTVQAAVRSAKATAGQLNLTLEICRDILVPICSMAEQKVIVRLLRSSLDALEGLGIRGSELTDSLMQLQSAVLSKAFRGELFPQEPSANGRRS